MTIRELRTNDELLIAAKWCRDRAEFAECRTCGRTLATCRQAGDLPIYLHSIDGPFCAQCYEEEADMPDTVDLDSLIDGEPIWKRVKRYYDAEAECTWPMATALVAGQVDGEMPHWRTVCAYAKKQAAGETPAPSTEDESPTPPAPDAPPAPASAQNTHLDGSIYITRGGVNIDVHGDDFAEVREVAIRILGGMRAIDAA